jgi:hypothetical protein
MTGTDKKHKQQYHSTTSYTVQAIQYNTKMQKIYKSIKVKGKTIPIFASSKYTTTKHLSSPSTSNEFSNGGGGEGTRRYCSMTFLIAPHHIGIA